MYSKLSRSFCLFFFSIFLFIGVANKAQAQGAAESSVGDYQGAFKWKVSGMANGNGQLQKDITVSLGTEAQTYKITIAEFGVVEDKFEGTVKSIIVDNVKLDADGKFSVQDVGITVDVIKPVKTGRTIKSHLSGSLKDHVLKIHTEGTEQLGFGLEVSMFVDFKGRMKPADSAPAKVENLAATVEGIKNVVTLSFTTPTKNYLGGTLESLTSIEIYRGDIEAPVHTMQATKGQTYTWKDEAADFMESAYEVIAVDASGRRGDFASLSVVVPGDKPGVILSHKIRREGKNVVIEWEPNPVGANGGPMTNDRIEYQIDRYLYGKLDDVLVKGVSNITSVTDEELPEDEQNFVAYVIFSESLAGYAEKHSITHRPFIVGKPLAVPFVESFNEGTFDSENADRYKNWFVRRLKAADKSSRWDLGKDGEGSISSQDKDNGFFVTKGTSSPGDIVRLVSPAISIASLKNPELKFWFHHTKSTILDNDALEVEISVDNAEIKTIKTIKVTDAEKSGWVLYTLPLSEYSNSERIVLGFKALFVDNNNRFALDNISVVDGESPTTALSSLLENTERIEIYGNESHIVINGATKETVQIYSVEGRLIASFEAAERERVSVESGVYIVKVAGKTEKVIVR